LSPIIRATGTISDLQQPVPIPYFLRMVVRLSVHFRPVSTVCKAKASVNRRIIEDEGATSTHGGQCWRASQPTEPVCPSTAAFILTGMTGGRRRHGIGIQSTPWRPGLARRGQLTSGDDDDVRPLPRKLLYASLLPGRPAGRPRSSHRRQRACGDDNGRREQTLNTNRR